MADEHPAATAHADQLEACCRDLLTAASHGILAVMDGEAVELAATAYLDKLDAIDPDSAHEVLARMCTTAARELVHRSLAHGDTDERACACPACGLITRVWRSDHAAES